MNELFVSTDRLYPNKVRQCSTDSKTIKQINRIKGKRGIGFYCFKRHEYVFIENTRI